MGAEIDTFSASSEGAIALGPAHWGASTAIQIAAPAPVRTRHSALASGAAPSSAVAPLAAIAIKAVLVDMDDVLYDGSAWDRWLAQIFGRLSPRTLEADFAQLWRETFLPVVHRGQQEFHAALACCLREIGLASSHVDEIVAASRAQRRRAQSNVRPFPAVRSTLASLQSAGIQRAVLANSDRTAQSLRQKLDRISLNGLFDHVLSTADLCASLSDDSCYARALETLRCGAGEVLFVGHCPRDLHAAQTAGLRAVGFNVRHDASTAKCVDRFEDLLALALPNESPVLVQKCSG